MVWLFHFGAGFTLLIYCFTEIVSANDLYRANIQSGSKDAAPK